MLPLVFAPQGQHRTHRLAVPLQGLARPRRPHWSRRRAGLLRGGQSEAGEHSGCGTDRGALQVRQRRRGRVALPAARPGRNRALVSSSAGIGRTGTFIVIDILIDVIREKGECFNCSVASFEDVVSVTPASLSCRGGLWHRRAKDHPDGSLPAVRNGADWSPVQIHLHGCSALHRNFAEAYRGRAGELHKTPHRSLSLARNPPLSRPPQKSKIKGREYTNIKYSLSDLTGGEQSPLPPCTPIPTPTCTE